MLPADQNVAGTLKVVDRFRNLFALATLEADVETVVLGFQADAIGKR